jgi:DegV family protein with EDD domain
MSCRKEGNLIKVITDSTADIPANVASKLNIGVVPIYLLWDGNSYRDGVDITPDEFYRRLVTGNSLPTTSQPAQADFENVYAQQAGAYDGIVSIHISGRLSGTYNAAIQASKALGDKIPIEVIDSRFNSIGLGLVVIAAARLAEAGGGMDQVVKEAWKAMSQVKMLGIFDTLKYTIAGGRINKSLGKIASVLNVKPLMTFRNGEVTLAGAVRVYAKGIEKIAEFVKKNLPVQDLGIVHSAAGEAAESLRQQIGQVLSEEKIYTNQLGASLGVHGGPGVLLVALRTVDAN